MGRKKIACFSITPSYLSTIEDRINGYKDALSKHTGSSDTAIIKPIHFENIQGDVDAAMDDLLKNEPELDAIYALNNHIATAILKSLKRKGFEALASKLKIACFDDIELFNIIDKQVLSVSQPIEEIGRNASILLLDIIEGKHENKSNIVLPTTLIER